MRSLVDVYPYRIIDGEIHFLLLHRAKGQVYEGQWRMVGGKVEADETHLQAALREFNEETGLNSSFRWLVPSINCFFDPKADQIRYIPAFAFQCGNEPICLNQEHDDYRWCSMSEAQEKVSWYEQKRIIGIIDDIITNSTILAEWMV